MSASKLLIEIQKLEFAMHEAALFLDRNPSDKQALEYFNYYSELAKNARKEYENHFGPLQYQDQHDINYWAWTKGPWPWEGEV